MANPLQDALPTRSVAVDAHADGWKQALTLAGDKLVEGGATTNAYTTEMLEAAEKLGPYFVIAPGVALVHSRPSAAVRHTGLSWVRLAEPVEFGHQKNDPVDLVIGLAATDHDSHLAIMAQLAAVLSDSETMQRLRTATSPEELHQALGA